MTHEFNKDDDGAWILNTDITANFHQRGRLVEAPKDLPKALRRVLGATKKWAMRYISECGGQADGQMADRLDLLFGLIILC